MSKKLEKSNRLWCFQEQSWIYWRAKSKCLQEKMQITTQICHFRGWRKMDLCIGKGHIISKIPGKKGDFFNCYQELPTQHRWSQLWYLCQRLLWQFLWRYPIRLPALYLQHCSYQKQFKHLFNNSKGTMPMPWRLRRKRLLILCQWLLWQLLWRYPFRLPALYLQHCSYQKQFKHLFNNSKGTMPMPWRLRRKRLLILYQRLLWQ